MNLRTILALMAVCAVQCASAIEPLIQAHAHNDYLHERPLFDALEHGFCSVEADIYLVNGELLVGHDLKKTKPGRTLEALYLDPLRVLVKKNGGHVLPNGPPFTLLIDLKTNWSFLYPILRTTLTNYADILTTFHGAVVETNAVQVIITGSRSTNMFAGERIRYAALDGEFADLDGKQAAALTPWVSIKWKDHFKWDGSGTMTTEERYQLRKLVQKAHAQNRRIRFWGTPDNPVFWQTMLSTKVDLINTDHLAGFESFIRNGKTR